MRNATVRHGWLAGLAGVVLITAVGVVPRVAQLHASLWLDELNTAWVAAGPSDQLGPRAWVGNQTQVYFWLPWASVRVWGLSEWSLRLPSLLAGIALIPSVAWVVWRWSGSAPAALAAALLAAWDQNCIFYAQEARVYAWVQLVALWHVYACWLRGGGEHGAVAVEHDAVEHFAPADAAVPSFAARAGFVISGTLLFYLHYSTALLIASGLVWLVWTSRRSARVVRLRSVAFDYAVLFVACLPATSQVLEIAGRRTNWERFINILPLQAAVDWFSLGAYVAVPLALLGVTRLLRRGRRDERAGTSNAVWGLVACWFLLPVVAAWGLSASDVARLFWPRYLMFVAVAPIVFAGLVLAQLPSRGGQLLGMLLVIAVSIVDQGGWNKLLFEAPLRWARVQDWRAAAARVRAAETTPNLPVFVRSGLIEADALRGDVPAMLYDLCRSPLLTIYTVDHAHDRVVPLPSTAAGQLDERAVRRLTAAGGGWFVVNGRESLQEQFAADLRQSIAQHDGRVLRLRRHPLAGTVQVWEAQLGD